jgi:hypothetical protein
LAIADLQERFGHDQLVVGRSRQHQPVAARLRLLVGQEEAEFGRIGLGRRPAGRFAFDFDVFQSGCWGDAGRQQRDQDGRQPPRRGAVVLDQN